MGFKYRVGNDSNYHPKITIIGLTLRINLKLPITKDKTLQGNG